MLIRDGWEVVFSIIIEVKGEPVMHLVMSPPEPEELGRGWRWWLAWTVPIVLGLGVGELLVHLAKHYAGG